MSNRYYTSGKWAADGERLAQALSKPAMNIPKESAPQIVEVEVRGKRLAYRWDGKDPLAVGDEVSVPAPYWAPNRSLNPEWDGIVCQLGSDYQGDLMRVMRRKNGA